MNLKELLNVHLSSDDTLPVIAVGLGHTSLQLTTAPEI